MNTPAKFRLSLHVSHPSWPAERIVKAFPFVPRYSRSVGAPRTTPRGTELGGIYEQTDITFAISDGVLDARRVGVAEFIEQSLDGFPLEAVHQIAESGGSSFFLVGLYTDGNLMCDFSSRLLGLLAENCLGAKFDFYGGPEIQE